MSCKTETKEINGVTYTATQWPAEKALLMKLKLLKVLGPSFAKLATLKDKVSDDKTDKVELLTDAVQLLFAEASPEEILGLIKTSIIGVSRNGEKLSEAGITTHFSGDDLLDIYKVFIFVIQVNYGNLLKGQWADDLLAKGKQSTKEDTQT